MKTKNLMNLATLVAFMIFGVGLTACSNAKNETESKTTTQDTEEVAVDSLQENASEIISETEIPEETEPEKPIVSTPISNNNAPQENSTDITDEDTEAEIREFVELMQPQIGMDFNGVVISDIYYDGKSLVYVNNISNISFSDIGMTKDEFINTTKDNMFKMGIPSFNENDRKFYRLLIDNGKGLTYKYNFNDGVTIVMKFSNSELKRLIKF